MIQKHKWIYGLLICILVLTSLSILMSNSSNSSLSLETNSPDKENLNDLELLLPQGSNTLDVLSSVEGSDEMSQYCTDALNHTGLLEKRRNTLYLGLFKNLRELNSQKAEAFLNHSRLSIFQYRQYVSEYPNDYHSLSDHDGEIEIPSISETFKITQLVLSRDYGTIARLIENGEINNNTNISGTSLLVFILISDKSVQLEDIQLLMNAGLIVNFADLVYATLLGFGANTLSVLLDNFNGDITHIWKNGVRSDNILLASISVLNEEAFDFWLSLGVPPSVSKSDFNALDILPLPANQVEAKIVDHIFETLIDSGILPYVHGSFYELREKVSFQAYQRKKHHFEDFNLYASQEPGVYETKLHRLAEELTAVNKEYDEFVAPSSCPAPKPDKAIWNSNNLVAEVEAISSLYSDVGVFDESTSSLLVSFFNKDWRTYIAQVLNFSGEEHQLQALSVLQLIVNKAPVDEVIEAVNGGAELADEAIFAIINSNRPELIEPLLPLGLNLSVRNSDGLTPLDYSMQFNDRPVIQEKIREFL